MKRSLILLVLITTLLLSSCGGFQPLYPDPSDITAKYVQNETLFKNAAREALAMEGDLFISTTEYHQPKNARGIEGLYVSDVKEENVRALESEAVSVLFDVCDVRSIATRREGELSACEFNCGGSGDYYCGVYYVSEDRPIFIGNFSAELTATEKGYSYEGNRMRYYTEKISPNFLLF